jgi:hypothetical protein
MSTDLQPIDAKPARDLVWENLGFLPPAPEGGIGPELCAEALRTTLWSIWFGSNHPVYITRLINAAARTLLPWQSLVKGDSSFLTETLHITLEELAAVGDLAALPGGRWVPTPLRSVLLPDIERYLLLGGIPTRLLTSRIRSVIERSGVARMTGRDPATLGADIGSLSSQEWLRLPSDSLEEWTSNILNTAHLDTAGDMTVDVYTPGGSGADQFHRWKQQLRLLPDGRYLARTKTRRGTIYYIVSIVGAQLEAVGVPDLTGGDVRRLMYGLDMRARDPVRVTAKQHGKHSSLELRSELPQAEHRLLLTIGRVRVHQDGKYYPRWWDIPTSYVGSAIDALHKLGVRVDKR